MICDLPNKFILTLFFNVPFYFLANLRRSPEAFFTFYLFAFVSLLTGSMLFRTIGAMSRTLTESIAPGAVFVMLLIVYTGFILPIPSMHPWLSWFRFIDPAAYVFESLMVNEVSASRVFLSTILIMIMQFSSRSFPCATFIPQGPSYINVDRFEKQCAVVSAQTGSPFISGSRYIQESFQYDEIHQWRYEG